MAHVLLPCDLPTWPEVQRQLAQVNSCKSGEEVAKLMAKIYEMCSVSLDPDDQQPNGDHPGFRKIKFFIDEILTTEERLRFLKRTLPDIASKASRLQMLKPPSGFLYSLKKEDDAFVLERSFVMSLLANAFFSTFPRRNAKTHPTLQDFGLADFYSHLNKRNHQKKLKAFLRYFEKLENESKGHLLFTRKVVTGPSLPGWLCSDRPLVPLVIRSEGNVHDSDPRVFRACSCSPSVGGDVLKTSTSQESKLFFTFPELLATLSFVESLDDNEAVLVEGVRIPSRQVCRDINFCFLDFSGPTTAGSQFEDKYLLRELNKAMAAFLHEPRSQEQRRHTPLGESSESETCSHQEKWARSHPVDNTWIELDKKRSGLRPGLKADSNPIPVESHTSGKSRGAAASYQMPSQKWKAAFKTESRSSSKVSMKTASQSSFELPPIGILKEEEYYTADEDSMEGSESEAGPRLHAVQKFPALTELVGLDRKRLSQSLSRETCSSNQSVGFVLGGGESEDEPCSQHERLEDFRKRIRKRTRRRRSSRSSSYLGSSGSSDMEDISEEEAGSPSYPTFFLRPASSEPSLNTCQDDGVASIIESAPLSPKARLSVGNRKMMVTSSNGRLKAYSYDGVNPNLPVPFKAKFRRRRHHSEEGERSFDKELLGSSSMLEGCSSMDNLSSCSHSERISSVVVEDPPVSRCFVAAEPSGVEDADCQMKAIILWLAASMARLPALILYTLQQPALQEIKMVYNKVLNRQWTVGDLSCELLRFCRNRLSPRRRVGVPVQLFSQLIGTETTSSLLCNLSQHSLD